MSKGKRERERYKEIVDIALQRLLPPPLFNVTYPHVPPYAAAAAAEPRRAIERGKTGVRERDIQIKG